MERIFIGIKVFPEARLKKFAGLLQKRLWRDDVRWIDDNNYHLTLKFIGNTSSDGKALLIEELSRNLDHQHPFTLEIKGAGVFGSFTKPKIIWIGADNTDYLKELWHKVELSAVYAGFEKEERLFHPHITIGRIKGTFDPEKLRSTVKEYENEYFQTQDLKEVILYKSTLKNSGPFYEPLKKFRFR